MKVHAKFQDNATSHCIVSFFGFAIASTAIFYYALAFSNSLVMPAPMNAIIAYCFFMLFNFVFNFTKIEMGGSEGTFTKASHVLNWQVRTVIAMVLIYTLYRLFYMTYLNETVAAGLLLFMSWLGYMILYQSMPVMIRKWATAVPIHAMFVLFMV